MSEEKPGQQEAKTRPASSATTKAAAKKPTARARRTAKAVAPAGWAAQAFQGPGDEVWVYVEREPSDPEATLYRWTESGFQVVRKSVVWSTAGFHRGELVYHGHDEDDEELCFVDAQGKVLRTMFCPEAARGVILSSPAYLCLAHMGSLWRVGRQRLTPVFIKGSHGPGLSAGRVETFGALVGSRAMVVMRSAESGPRVDVVVADLVTGAIEAWPPRKAILTAFTATREGFAAVIGGELFTPPAGAGDWPEKSHASLADCHALRELPGGDLVGLPNDDDYLIHLARRGAGFRPPRRIALLQRRDAMGTALVPAGEGEVILLGGSTPDADAQEDLPLLPEVVDLRTRKSASLPGWEAETAKLGKLTRMFR